MTTKTTLDSALHIPPGVRPAHRIPVPPDWHEDLTHAEGQEIEFNPDPIEDLDSASIFAGVAAREVALDGELQATQVALAQIREIGVNVVSWFANYKAGLASLPEMGHQIDSLHEQCRTTDAHDFGAHVLLTNERQTALLEQARATIEAFISGETTMGALSRLADAINDALPATSFTTAHAAAQVGGGA